MCYTDNKLSIQFLSVMRVVVKTGGGYVIPPEDIEQRIGQQEDQPRPRGRRNIRGCGERGQLVHQHVPMGATTFGEDTMVGYFNQMTLNMNWIGGTMEKMIWHFSVTQPPHLGDHYHVFLTWSEYRTRCGDGAVMS